MKKLTLIALILFFALLTSLAGERSTVVLTAKDAILEGLVRPDDTYSCLGWWCQPKDVIRFKIPKLKEGKYRVIIKYSVQEGFGGEASIKLNERIFEDRFNDTGGWEKPAEKRLGNFHHGGGDVDIALSILKQNYKNNTLMNVYSLILEEK